MEAFLKFIKIAKEGLNNFKRYNVIHLVLGNESSDLDSTVSALSLAYLIYSKKSAECSDYLVIPIINVDAKYFPLRTEVCYLLQKFGIDKNTLIFRDQIQYSNILTGKVKTSIVDHHVLSNHDKTLEDTVVEIFDHRKINISEICKSNVLLRTVIKTVGSCTTLVAEEIINSKLPILFEELCHLLYATIIFDTIGLNKNFGKTFDEDVSVVEQLENIMEIPQNRTELFNLLWQIHTDTSDLTAKNLLYRDLKMIKGVPMPVLPMLVEDYLKRGDADVAIQSFANENNTSSFVILGINAGKEVMRDLAIFSTDLHFRNVLIDILKNSQQIAGSDLELTEICTMNKSIVCFKQGNNKLTRKFILPLVEEAILQCSKTI